jgi:hypothetical protein
MTDDIPQWAKERACALVNAIDDGAFTPVDCEFSPLLAFARYIAEHEAPPVDPLLIEARKLLDLAWPGEDALGGGLDNNMWMQRTLAALKRGIEIGASK